LEPRRLPVTDCFSQISLLGGAAAFEDGAGEGWAKTRPGSSIATVAASTRKVRLIKFPQKEGTARSVTVPVHDALLLRVLERAAILAVDLGPLRASMANLMRNEARADLFLLFADHRIGIRRLGCRSTLLGLRLRLGLRKSRSGSCQNSGESKTRYQSNHC
jgi:hypothetical protein